jgi:hypothetical protein
VCNRETERHSEESELHRRESHLTGGGSGLHAEPSPAGMRRFVLHTGRRRAARRRYRSNGSGPLVDGARFGVRYRGRSCRLLVIPHRLQVITSYNHLPIIKIVNDPGTGGVNRPRPPLSGTADAAGAGSRSWLIVKM